MQYWQSLSHVRWEYKCYLVIIQSTGNGNYTVNLSTISEIIEDL